MVYNNIMGRRVIRKRNPIVILILVFIFVVCLVVGGAVLWRTLTGKLPFEAGVITYDDSLTEEEKIFIENTIGENTLKKDVTISAITTDTPANSETQITYDILVPITDYYDTRSSISSDAEDLMLESIKNLKSTDKLLALDGNYFFDDFEKGAKFRIFQLNGEEPSEIHDLLNAKISLPNKDTVLSINQTGVTALTRGMLKVLNSKGDATYFSEKIADFLKKTDYTHISNEVSFAENCSVDSGSTTLCSDWRMLDVITDIDTDIIELTGNHNNDYSTENNLKTLEKYTELGLKTFGGGKDEENARIPLKINDKNTKITWLAYNQSTSTKANGQGANGDEPGANIYDEEIAKKQIAEAKANGDFVIVDIQYFECYSYPEEGEEMPECDAPITGQEKLFKDLIDMGADMVVGTQAHHPQTFELYNGKPIFYGLGNLFFDQIYWPGTTRSYVLTHYFWNGNYIQTRISGTVYDGTYQTRLMDEDNLQWFLNRLAAARTE